MYMRLIAFKHSPRLPSAAVVGIDKHLSNSYSSSSMHTQPPPQQNAERYSVNLGFGWKGQGSHADPHSTSTESKILAASLPFVALHGWSQDALGEGAKSLGLSSASRGLFPRGGVELVEYFVRRTTGEVSEEMAGMDLSSTKVTAKVRLGVMLRLERLKPYISKWPEALALMALPHNAPTALINLGELCDEIWFSAGDRSHDMNWYSKRALLAGVYTSTELFMTQDKTPGFEETERFLDRRLQDVAFVGRSMAEFRNLAAFGIKSAQGVLASRGFKI